jgi:hypothetical protein
VGALAGYFAVRLWNFAVLAKYFPVLRHGNFSRSHRIAHEFPPTTRNENGQKLQKFPVLSRETANCAETVSPQTASTAKKNTLSFNGLRWGSSLIF